MFGLFKKKTPPRHEARIVEPPKERRLSKCGLVEEKHTLPEFGEVWVIVQDDAHPEETV